MGIQNNRSSLFNNRPIRLVSFFDGHRQTVQTQRIRRLIKDTEFCTAAHAARASSVSQLTAYF